MKRKQKQYYSASNYNVYVNKSKNLAYVELVFPLGSRELDNVIKLLEKYGYLTKYYSDKKGAETDEVVVDEAK